jgi:type IV pilus assembly protein PilW
MRITSVRLVLVARNGQPEKKEVTTNPPTWRGSTVSASGDALPLNGESLSIDLSTNVGVPTGFTWNNYRYKVFQTVVPLRNMTTVVLEGRSAGC